MGSAAAEGGGERDQEAEEGGGEAVRRGVASRVGSVDCGSGGGSSNSNKRSGSDLEV